MTKETYLGRLKHGLGTPFTTTSGVLQGRSVFLQKEEVLIFMLFAYFCQS